MKMETVAERYNEKVIMGNTISLVHTEKKHIVKCAL